MCVCAYVCVFVVTVNGCVRKMIQTRKDVDVYAHDHTDHTIPYKI